MLFGFFGFMILLAIAIAIMILIFANTVDQPSVNVGTVMLDCPHCGRETPSHLETCQLCGKSFRESVVNPTAAENSKSEPRRD